MARDKRTRRAEARRRYREQLRAEEERAKLVPITEIAAGQEPAGTPAETRSFLTTIASGFTLPDVRGDLRALPWIATHTWAFALPLAAAVATFLVALDADVFFRRITPGESMTAGLARLLYEFVLMPGAGMTAVFLGAVLAPRGGWLVGALVGLAATAAFLVLLGIHGPPDYFPEALTPSVALSTFGLYLPIFVLLGGFAGWYRRWIMGMQARTRQRAEERRRTQAREAKRGRTAPARR